MTLWPRIKRIVCSIRSRGISALIFPPCEIRPSMKSQGDTFSTPENQELDLINGCIFELLSSKVKVKIESRKTRHEEAKREERAERDWRDGKKVARGYSVCKSWSWSMSCWSLVTAW